MVPTKGRPDRLRTCLSAVALAADRCDGHVEIIVIDDGPDIQTRKVVEGLLAAGCRFRYMAAAEHGRTGPADARNLGLEAATGWVVAFTDDDVHCDRDWLANGVGLLRANPTLAGVEGKVSPYAATPFDAARARVVANLHGNAFLTANMLFRCDAVEAVGGFRTFRADTGWRFPFREDTDLALRVQRNSGAILFAPEVLVWHPIEQIGLRRHIVTASYFVVDGAFMRLHPTYVPSPLAKPFARLRIRLACLSVLSIPLLIGRRSRPIGTLAIALCALCLDLQVERELREAGVPRAFRAKARDVFRRFPRSVAWCVAAGAARIGGEFVARFRVLPTVSEPNSGSLAHGNNAYGGCNDR